MLWPAWWWLSCAAPCGYTGAMALDPTAPFYYFHPPDEGEAEDDAQAAALVLLRARMGDSYATTPDDAALLRALARAVAFVERATGRFFVQRTGTLILDGTGDPRLPLPHPVVSTDQGGEGVTAVVIGRTEDDEETVDAADYVVTDGALVGPGDPRDNPAIELIPSSSVYRAGPWWGQVGCWPGGKRMIQVTATWGYLEEDGSTPEPIVHLLARLCIQQVVALDDADGKEDSKRGAIVAEQTQGRSYQLGAQASGYGLTLDREMDQIIATYKRPPRVVISRAPKRASRVRRYLP